MLYSERWYQAEAEFSIFDWFSKNTTGHPIVAMPTATGKSVVIAKFIRKVFQLDQMQRVMLLTHVKDLIAQNAQKLVDIWPTAPLGIYSAGLNQRDMVMPIIFAGVQSVAKAIERELKINDLKPDTYKHFGKRHIVIIDECHLLSPDEEAQYQYVIKELMRINPGLIVIGFSATPWRAKQGKLTNEGGIFTHICYDLTSTAAFNRLIAEGYLANMIARPTRTKIDLTNVPLIGGEFVQSKAEKVIDTDEITYAACRETIEFGYDRKAWLVFTAGIDNCEHIASVMQSMGVNALAYHSKLKSSVNDERLKMYKAGELLCLVSNNKATTGIDHPPIDLISDLQPTTASAKQVQKGGRGFRPSPETGKENCLFLDFCGNIPRCGPFNDPKIPGEPGKKGAGDMPVKICDKCGVYNAAAARVCFNCGFEFTFETVIFGTAGTTAPLKEDSPIVQRFEVSKILYMPHEKRNAEGVLISPPSIKVNYFCGIRMFSEWVCLEHSGPVGKRARDWWRQRMPGEPPLTTQHALQLINNSRWPKYITVHLNKKYPEIQSYEF